MTSVARKASSCSPGGASHSHDHRRQANSPRPRASSTPRHFTQRAESPFVGFIVPPFGLGRRRFTAGDGGEGVGEHRQGDVAVPGVVLADLVVVQPGRARAAAPGVVPGRCSRPTRRDRRSSGGFAAGGRSQCRSAPYRPPRPVAASGGVCWPSTQATRPCVTRSSLSTCAISFAVRASWRGSSCARARRPSSTSSARTCSRLAPTNLISAAETGCTGFSRKSLFPVRRDRVVGRVVEFRDVDLAQQAGAVLLGRPRRR